MSAGPWPSRSDSLFGEELHFPAQHVQELWGHLSQADSLDLLVVGRVWGLAGETAKPGLAFSLFAALVGCGLHGQLQLAELSKGLLPLERGREAMYRGNGATILLVPEDGLRLQRGTQDAWVLIPALPLP